MISYKYKLEELNLLASEITKKITNGVIILQGDLATGKTTLVKEIAKSLGLSDEVTSPTFSLQHCYGDNFFHYDIYNHGLNHFISLGMLEELDKKGLHFVEWGDDKLVDILNSAEISNIKIKIKKISNDIRQYEVNYACA